MKWLRYLLCILIGHKWRVDSHSAMPSSRDIFMTDKTVKVKRDGIWMHVYKGIESGEVHMHRQCLRCGMRQERKQLWNWVAK